MALLGSTLALAMPSTSCSSRQLTDVARSSVIAARKGAPVDQARCWGSPMSIGDTISILSSPDTSVADINALWNGNTVSGWMYLGDDKVRFVQSKTLRGYGGIDAWNGRLPRGTRVVKCFAAGRKLA